MLHIAFMFLVGVARCLDKAAIKTDRPKGRPVSLTEVEETKAFLGIMPLFLCICIYQMAYVSLRHLRVQENTATHSGCSPGVPAVLILVPYMMHGADLFTSYVEL